MKRYIRFGDVPKNERSGIYRGDMKIGEELGVSVYDTIYLDGNWRIVLPEKLRSGMAHTLYGLLNSVLQDEFKVNNSIKVFLVTGNEVGRGSDNEPLLRNVSIIKELSLNKKD